MESYQITKNRINLKLIEIIQLCLKMYVLWRLPHLSMNVLVGGWMVGSCQITNKEAIWLYAELFLGHHDGSCYGLW